MKNAPLMRSTSGIRGIVGASLDPIILTQYTAGFAKFVKHGKIVIGSDGRPSGDYISGLVISTLILSGCEVIDLGIVPTPTVEMAVKYHKADGGIAITASHNPIEWNALKFFNSLGEFITKSQYAKLEKIVSSGKFDFAPHDKVGSVRADFRSIDRHIKSVLAIRSVSKPKIKKQKFKVVLDAINGAGSFVLPELLERLGVDVVRLNCKGDGDFFRKPEPTPDNLTGLGKAVRKHKADLGMACDPDADRLALVDETGRPIGEELTLALAVRYYLLKNKGPVAVNLSTSRATADMARINGCKTFLAPVGEANVIDEMKKRKAIIGGEGNGGVILPESHYGRDSLVAAILVLACLAEANQSLSSLAGTIPNYYNIKIKAVLPDRFEAKLKRLEKEVRASFKGIKVDKRDGLHFSLDDAWFQVRKSNTEPIYRLIVEARTETVARKLKSMTQKCLK